MVFKWSDHLKGIFLNGFLNGFKWFLNGFLNGFFKWSDHLKNHLKICFLNGPTIKKPFKSVFFKMVKWVLNGVTI